MSEILSTSAGSPDSLPPRGYTIDQLCAYILRQMGDQVWNIEITKQQVLDSVNDALAQFSTWCPKPLYQSVQLVRNQFRYLSGRDMDMGVVDVGFTEPLPTPTAIFYGNLIDPAPLFRAGLDDYALFLNWRKTWMRVTSVQPDWLWDDTEKVLYIHNPIERYHASVVAHGTYRKTDDLPQFGAVWVKQYALEKSRLQLGELYAKFSGAIPGPVKDLTLDVAKRDKAAENIEKLEQKLFNMQRGAELRVD